MSQLSDGHKKLVSKHSHTLAIYTRTHTHTHSHAHTHTQRSRRPYSASWVSHTHTHTHPHRYTHSWGHFNQKRLRKGRVNKVESALPKVRRVVFVWGSLWAKSGSVSLQQNRGTGDMQPFFHGISPNSLLIILSLSTTATAKSPLQKHKSILRDPFHSPVNSSLPNCSRGTFIQGGIIPGICHALLNPHKYFSKWLSSSTVICWLNNSNEVWRTR